MLLVYGVIAEQALGEIAPEFAVIKAAGLAALVKTVNHSISRDSVEVLAYGQQIQQWHQQTTLIPIRYGSVLVDEAAVIEYLRAHQTDYQALLLELADCDEMGVRLLTELRPADCSAQSGLAYLQARKQAYAVPAFIERQVCEINKALAGLYRQQNLVVDVFNGYQSYLLSYLVPRQQLMLFQQMLADIDNQGVVSGPWPVYSFVN